MDSGKRTQQAPVIAASFILAAKPDGEAARESVALEQVEIRSVVLRVEGDYREHVTVPGIVFLVTVGAEM